MSTRRLLSTRWGAPGLTWVLLVGLSVVNVAAIWEILSARRDARALARRDLTLRVNAQGQGLQARLANLRSDLAFLGESPAVEVLAERLASNDPVARRWGRLDAEGALLLFLQAHAAVERLVLEVGEAAEGAIVVGRQGGVPTVLGPATAAEAAAPGLLSASWSVGGNGEARLESRIDVRSLLPAADQAGLEELAFHVARPPEPAADGRLTAATAVRDDRWIPPLAGWVSGTQGSSEVERSVAALAGRYRRTVLWNLCVVLAVSAVVFVALRQTRSRVAAEARAEQERRVRELERGLLHSERLASVGRFAAGVAHEVNNPLEGMGNFLGLLEGDLAAGRLDRARQHARRIRDGLERAATILHRVLAFSDPARAPRERLDLADPVSEAVAFLVPRFPAVEVTVDPGPEALAVEANRVTLGQLFLNLLLNACELQEGGGRVEVALERVGQEAVVRVADEGPGLSEEVSDHLFEPFFSTRGSTGLGLAVCHGIAREHGGSLAAGNRADARGAVFELRLPLAPGRQGRVAPSVEGSSA
jgi:signal transduction histidine kinase